MDYKNGFVALLALGMILLASIGTVSADDQLKPYLDQAYKFMKDSDQNAGNTFFRFFPGFEDSLNSTLSWLDEKISFMKDNHWIFYVVFFIVVVSLLIKVWERSDGYVINSIVGIAALLILIHVLGVLIRVTLLRFALVLVLGLGGVLIVLAMHYLGWVI